MKNIIVAIFLFIVSFLFTCNTYAYDFEKFYDHKLYNGVDHNCIYHAANKFEVPYWLIVAILGVEGGWIGLKMDNTNNTYDLGPMQINTIWVPFFEEYGYTQKEIMHDGCLNVMLGTWILSTRLNRYSDLGKAIGAYHSKTPEINLRYQERVLNIVDQILNGLDVKKIIDRANGR